MPCVLFESVGNRLLLVRVPPDEISEASEEGDHQADRDHPCEHHIIDKHETYLRNLIRVRWVQVKPAPA